MTVTVYCSSSDTIDERYVEAAKALAPTAST